MFSLYKLIYNKHKWNNNKDNYNKHKNNKHNNNKQKNIKHNNNIIIIHEINIINIIIKWNNSINNNFIFILIM